MRPLVPLAAGLVVGLVLAAAWHSFYSAEAVTADDPWRLPAGYLGPRILDSKGIIVELDHPKGLAPVPAALARFEMRIENATGLPVELKVSEENVPASGKVSFDEIVATERAHRNEAHFQGDRVAVYILYVGGVYSEADSVLGISYLGLSAAVFRDAVEQAGTPNPDPGRECQGVLRPTPCEIERAVLVHEFGHLLGLVNIGYESAQPHFDSKHGHHCTDERCVMYWQIEAGIGVTGPPPDDFSPHCIGDLKVIRAKGLQQTPRFLSDWRYVLGIAVFFAGPLAVGAILAWWLRGKREEVPPPPPPPPVPP